MPESRILLAPNTWTDLATVVATWGGHLILTPRTSDFQIAVKAATAPTVAGQTVPKDEAVEVILSPNAGVKVWVRSTAGGYLDIDDMAAKTVIVAPSVAVA